MQKIAVVTGASNGLGKAVTELLASKNIIVFALARNVRSANLPKSVQKIPCNVRDLDSIDAAFAQIDEQADHIDFLVNCAGRGLQKSFEETSREEIMDVFGVNLKGNVYIAQEVYKRMLPKHSGHIINVGSTSSLRARETEVLYCASKWGLRGFTESLRLAAKPHGIQVTGVYPGGMRSDHFWQISPGKDISSFMDPADVAAQIGHILLDSPGVDMAEVVIERP